MTMMTITTDLSDHEFEAALDAAIETGNPDARVKVVEMYYESRMETAYAYQRATSADSRFEVTYADNRAALARAEAAEAEAEDAILVASDAAQREESAMHALSHFRARVAELESQLAAQGWRPVTEKPEPDQKVEIIIEATFDGYGRKGWTTGGFYFNADFPTGWRPLPPAP